MHTKVPRNLRENLLFRKALWNLSPSENEAIYEACRKDCLFWINAFVWQYNPNTIGTGSLEIGPFITWEFQDRAVELIEIAIEDRKDLLIEKSREMGASWLCLLKILHRALFRDWQKFLVISRNEHAVDRPGDPDCLFWKLHFVLDRLPSWMVAGIEPRKMAFNFANGSSINGQASTGKAGVGGRATAMFIDEFSQIAEDFEVLHRTSDTTGCRIFNGTHRGTGTAFHELSERVDMRKLTMHWTQHPDKRKGLYHFQDNKIEVLDKTYHFPADFTFALSEAPAGGPHPGLRSPWYDAQCLRKGNPRAVAMDLDIDPSGSAAQFFNPVTIRQLRNTYCIPPTWEGDISIDLDSGKPIALVELPGGPLKLWLQPKPDGSMPKSKYGAGCDVSTGQGATNSCLSVIDARTGEKVAEYSSPHVSPQNLAPIVTSICRFFTDENNEPAKLAWEHVGPGQVFGKRLLELGYRHIHFRQSGLSVGGFKETEVPGWFPTPEHKLQLLTDYRAALDSRQCVNRCDEALRECLYYRYRKDGFIEHSAEDVNDPTGARVNHGDRVVADALAWKMCATLGTPQRKEEEKVAVGSLAWRRKIRDDRRKREEVA